ncbi:MAG: SPFH domain-containing protein [Clostridiales bacterium]|nr:SPFH domain-containing protein [Clostridiales bacterium]
MGLIKAAFGTVGGTLADQWKEFFYCEAIPADILAVKGKKKVTGRSSNRKGDDNIITNGSVIAVADGQCMLIVEQGKVVDMCAEPGEYTYDMSTEPSVFSGDLGESIKGVFQNMGKRFTFGGEAPKNQRIYYFNTKEIMGNKYGTAKPIGFRVVDEGAAIDMDIPIRCFGEYSYRIVNPLLFYTNICSNISEEYPRSALDGALRTDLMTALQTAFAKLSAMGIRYSMLAGHTTELTEILKEVLSAKWRDFRGIEIVAFGINSVSADEEVEKEIREMQKEMRREAAYADPTRAAGALARAQAEAMKAAATNPNAGPAMAFMGMGLAGQVGGMKMQDLYQMGQAAGPAASAGWTCACGQAGNTGRFCAGCGQPQPVSAERWQCACGAAATGKFCPECGKPKPAADSWTCGCGAANKGKFCTACGAKKPAGVPQYRCDKCGWEPADPAHPPKFCPECGDPFDDGDLQG